MVVTLFLPVKKSFSYFNNITKSNILCKYLEKVIVTIVFVSFSSSKDTKLTKIYIFSFLDSNLRSVCLSDSLSYLCQIQIRPDHVHDALSDARYVSFICEEASNKLGYEDYDNYVTDHKSKLWTSFDTVADLQSVRKSSLE